MNEQGFEFAVVEPADVILTDDAGAEDVVAENEQPAPTKKKRHKTKVCPVARYVEAFGIVGFYFDGVPCQITVKPGTVIGKTVTIKYTGDIKTGISFWL